MFFSQFPSVGYDFNRTGTIDRMVNIFRSIRPETVQELNNVTVYKDLEILNGTRPDVLSQKLYGTPDYYWTFFIINDFLHDGLQAWPMSQDIMTKYLESNYSGIALCFKPTTITDADGIAQGTKNSVAGILELGEIIYGGTSGAIGRLVRKDADLNQIILQDVVPGIPGTDPFSGAVDNNIVGGNFKPDEFLSASRTTLDSLTLFSLSVNKVYDYSQAPAYYYEIGDDDKRPITNSDGIQQLLNVYSDVQWDSALQRKIGGFNIDNFGSVTSSIQSNSTYGFPILHSGGYIGNGEILREGYINDSLNVGGIAYVTNEQHIKNLNDKRSSIKIIDPTFITTFVEEFENLING